MDTAAIADFLIKYIGLIVLLSFHEWGHAWVALKCGDDTARQMGRVSINPIVHICPIGTVLMPILGFVLSGSALGSFIIGWAKPVPVNPNNLRQPRIDDTLIAMAGPMMNLLLGALLIGVAKIGVMADAAMLQEIGFRFAALSLFLCFFNLLPIPPLDGSHVVKNLVGMSWEFYMKIAQFGFILVIIAIQIPGVNRFIYRMTVGTLDIFASLFGLRLN
ncbi:MAG: site-2 protease family protein [Verrucomicrobia bacterium]|nr:site-2 protease family protein [Verrucomicrobiota bacterium]